MEDTFYWLSGTELGSIGARKLLCGISVFDAGLSFEAWTTLDDFASVTRISCFLSWTY